MLQIFRIEKETISGVISLASTLHFYLVAVTLCEETHGMQDLEIHLTGVEDVETGTHPGGLIEAVTGVNNLSLQRVLVELVEGEVTGESIPHKGIMAAEYNLYNILLCVEL
jgi:hypothetical protein